MAKSSSSSGKALLLDLLDLDLEARLLAGQLLVAVVLGEGDLDRALLARGGSGELLLEALDQPARAELEQVAARLAALEGLVVDVAGEVDHHEVAVGGLALDGLQRRGGLAHPLQLGVHLVGGDLRLAAPDLDALVVAELGLGPHAHLDGEGQRVPRVGHSLEVDVWIADRGDTRVLQRLLVPARQSVAHGLVEHGLAAHALEHHLSRHLALAKAGDLEVLAELFGCAQQLVLDLVGANLHAHAYA